MHDTSSRKTKEFKINCNYTQAVRGKFPRYGLTTPDRLSRRT